MFINLEKPFLLLDYAKTMARTSPTTGPTSELHLCYLEDPRVLDFIDISATNDFADPLDSSASCDEDVIVHAFHLLDLTLY
jgi:hypothetical protein